MKKKIRLNTVQIICWCVTPLIIIVAVVLDCIGVYVLTTVRGSILVLLLISLLIPVSGKIKIGKISITPKNKR